MKNELSELEVSKVEQFCNDEAMFNAVRKVLLAGLYSHGVVKAGFDSNPLINGAFSLVSLSTENPIPDEVIGQQLRAQWAGLNALENALSKAKEIKTEKKAVETPFNNAI